MYGTFVLLPLLFCVPGEINTANGIALFANISQGSGNNVEFPSVGHQNRSQLQNITSNKLDSENTPTVTSTIKTPLTRIVSETQSIIDLVDGYEGTENNTTTVLTPLSSNGAPTDPPTGSKTHAGNNTSTASPSHGIARHHFNVRILDYILIPGGCVLAVVIAFFMVRHVQKVRRKRRLERELFHQYSYPNSEADDMEEQNIGEIESVINAQFVSFSDRSDKSLYEDTSEVNLTFDESSKLVVQEVAPVSPEQLEASTSFTS